MGKNLIWHLNEEANSLALKDTINESNEAMATAKVQGKGKEKQTKAKCTNCKTPGHTTDQCWMKGGGRRARHWTSGLNLKSRRMQKTKSGKNKSANAAHRATMIQIIMHNPKISST